MKTKYLISGGTGLIGSGLISSLQKDGVVYSFPSGLDLSKPELINFDGFPPDIDVIIHLANPRNFKDFPGSARETFGVNVAATMSLLEYARKNSVKTFALASTGGIGHVNNFYSTTKLCAELLAKHYEQYMNIVILNFFFVYGPGQDKTRLIPRLIDAVVSGEPIKLKGWSGININPIYVTDAVEAIVASLKLSGRFDICGNEILSIRQMSEVIGEFVGKDPVFEETPEPGRNIIGNNEISTPGVSFREGISKMLEST